MTAKAKKETTRTTPWQKALPFALLSLVCFVLSMGLLLLMLWKAERLVTLGLVGNLYYIVLLPLGLAVAGFLFGVFRSYAHYKGKQLGGTLELGGPIVGFVLVVIGGFYLPKPAPESFDVTVLVHGEKGDHDLVLRNSGTVWMTLGPDRRNEKIGDKGQADFKNIPAKFRVQDVPISIEATGFEPVTPSAKYQIGNGSVSVVLRRQPLRLSGRVQDSEGHPVAHANVRIGGLKAEVDADGHFVVLLPPDGAEDSLEAEVSAPGSDIWRGKLTPNSGEAAIMLKRTP